VYVCVCVCVCQGWRCIRQTATPSLGKHSVAFSAKIAVYQAVVLSTLLYGCQSWVLYRRSVRRLAEFHMRCLRRIAGIKWQDRVPNTEVLRLCGISGIEAVSLTAQFRWVGHIIRMDDNRIPKHIFFGQLSSGKRPPCGPLRRYKHTVKVNMKRCGLQPKTLTTATLDRAYGHSLFSNFVCLLLPTVLAGKAKQSVTSVCLSVC